VTSVRTDQILAEVMGGVAVPADAPQRLVLACTRALRVTGVGLVLMTDAGPAGTVAVSDSPAGTMEELQFTLGEGPCVECSHSGRPVLQPDLAHTGPPRWPGFTAGALEAGIRAIFAFPLRVGGVRLGVLDIYRDTAGDLSDAEMTEALSFADAAVALVLHLQSEQSRGHVEGTMPGAVQVVEDRAEVHQATGMVAVQADVSMTEALVRLRARAFATERPIVRLAQDVLAGVVHFRDESDGGR
jgi:GAF domain-containing protein